MAEDRLPKGPYTLWTGGGYEGWSFEDYETFDEAVHAQRWHSDWVITRAPVKIVEGKDE